MSYHWKQVESNLHIAQVHRPGIAWSQDFRDIRTAIKHQPLGGCWLLARGKDGAVADPETLGEFCWDLHAQSEGCRVKPTVASIKWIT